VSASRIRILPRQQSATAKGQRLSLREWLIIGLFVLPGAVIYILFLIFPIFQAAYYSLFKWSGLGAATDFRGLSNYTQVLNHSVFRIALEHSLLIVVLSLLIQLPTALLLAIAVGRKLKGRSIFRTIFFLPYVFSEIITAILWTFVYHKNGLVNIILSTFIQGYHPATLLADTQSVLFAVFAVITWKYFGLQMILYMAGLQQVSIEIEDAARIDGASEWGVLRFITIPMMGPTIRLTVFLSVLGSLNQFAITWVLTTGGPVNASELVATYMYKFGIVRFNLGYGATVAVILFLISLIFSVGYQRTLLRQDYAGKAS
jgi:raffinose/stachyose/melibiose transport system permease protein